MFRSRMIVALPVAVLLAAPGCVHQMKVKNLAEYQLTAQTEKRHSVRLTGPTALEGTPYSEMIRDGLEKHPSIREVALANEPQYDIKPDVDVHADVKVKYRGSGANFPITFPGFLLFTHAWNGYVYKADIVTTLTVTPAAGGAPRTRTLETTYDMRHCDFGRGFWSSSGWFLPGWGATSLFAGLYMTGYDTDATPEFSKVVHDAYGAYAANNIAAMIAETETQPVAASNENSHGPAAAAQTAESGRAVVAAKPAADKNGARAASAPGEASDDDYNQRVWAEQAKKAE
jgi:hypothetical protein